MINYSSKDDNVLIYSKNIVKPVKTNSYYG